MANYDLGALMDRLLEMEKEAVDESSGVAYFPYEQESFPYWTNRIVGMTPDYVAQDIAHYPFRIAARLVLGHLTEGYKGELILSAYDHIAAVTAYFKDRPGMNSNAHTTQMEDIFTDFELVDVIGPAAFRNDGIGNTQVGIEFIFTLPVIDVQFR